MDKTAAVLRVEPLILAVADREADETTIPKARLAIAGAISQLCSLECTKGMTLAQHIEAATDAPTGARKAALLIVRCSSVQKLLPPNSYENQIDRKIVALVERMLPDFCHEFNLNSCKLTNEKYPMIADIHVQIMQMLSPPRALTDFKESLIVNKQTIQKALSRKIVNAYLSIYGFSIIRTNIESLISLLYELTSYNHLDFSEKLNRMMAILESQKHHCTYQRSFLTDLLVESFYDRVDSILYNLRAEAEDRFKCNIRTRRTEPNAIEKRYPIHEPGRELHIHIPLVNDGPGVAIDVRAEIITDTDDIHLHSSLVDLGNVPRGNFTLSCDARVVKESEEVNLAVELSWSSVSDASRRTVEFDAAILPQAKNVDWATLATEEPYSQDVAKGEEFVGRREKVNAILARLRKTKMQSTYIHGQKRIGKTSIAPAVRDHMVASEPCSSYTFIAVEWGDYNNANPAKALENLGQLIASELTRYLPSDIAVPASDFSGSLAPLNQIAVMLLRHQPNRRFVIILDEFDEMPQPMYRGSTLADVYFSNLRSLAAKDNIAFVLVGGELMPYIIASQGDKLNKFVAEKVDYFSRSHEWDDYVDLVRKPVAGRLNWHDSAVADLFNLTNGHPYYTRIVCSRAYANAVRERDTELTSDEVSRAVDGVVAAQEVNSFAHLWKDGIPGTDDECDVAELRRQRLLVAAARTIRAGQALTVDDVVKLGRPPLPPDQVALELTDLCRRDILRENNGSTANVVSPEEALRIIRQVDLVGDPRYKSIVIVDDVVATGSTMSDNLDRFLEEGKRSFVELGVVVLAVAVAATPEGEGHVRDLLHRYNDIKVDIRVCDPITRNNYAFERANGLWETEAELREARILCKEIGNRIYPKAPLGYGDLGLLVVFPDTCPNNSLPILHAGDVAGGVWTPLFPRPKN